MKIKSNHLVMAALALVAGFVLFVAFRDRLGAAPSKANDADFLASVRESAAASTPGGEEGLIPSTLVDQTLVPQIEFDTDALDVGVIPNDAYSVHEFKVYNRGKADLEIKRIDTECNCTVGQMKDATPIAPGQSGILAVRMNPYLIPAWTSAKKLTITSNDPKRPVMMMLVLAKVDPEFEAEPESFDFGTAVQGEPKRATMLIRQLNDEPLAVTGFDLGEAGKTITARFAARPQETWRSPGKTEYEVTLELLPDLPAGKVRGAINILTTVKRLKDFQRELSAEILPRDTGGFAVSGAPSTGANAGDLTAQE